MNNFMSGILTHTIRQVFLELDHLARYGDVYVKALRTLLESTSDTCNFI